MEQKELASILSALADVSRLQIVRLLASQAEMGVGELALQLRAERPTLSQPLISWHLRVLRKRELILWRREGRQVLYALNRNRWRQVVDRLDALTTPQRVAAPVPALREQLRVPTPGQRR